MELACAEGESHVVTGSHLGISKITVGKWRRHYLEQGLEGLEKEEPRTHDAERVAEMSNTALHSKPPQGTDWGASVPWRSIRASPNPRYILGSRCLVYNRIVSVTSTSNDPFFVEKVRDIVGLYMNLPGHAVVLCVDEKTQIQALEHTQLLLSLRLGYVESITQDYIHNGRTTLFVALDVATGKVLTECKERHRHQEFLAFLKHTEANVPDFPDIHLMVDNECTHKHGKVKEWLAVRPRFHVHYTPTDASWINQVERWFGLITQQAIRRGSFPNVKELTSKNNSFVEHYNAKTSPFAWLATAESTLAKILQVCKPISGTQH